MSTPNRNDFLMDIKQQLREQLPREKNITIHELDPEFHVINNFNIIPLQARDINDIITQELPHAQDASWYLDALRDAAGDATMVNVLIPRTAKDFHVYNLLSPKAKNLQRQYEIEAARKLNEFTQKLLFEKEQLAAMLAKHALSIWQPHEYLINTRELVELAAMDMGIDYEFPDSETQKKYLHVLELARLYVQSEIDIKKFEVLDSLELDFNDWYTPRFGDINMELMQRYIWHAIQAELDDRLVSDLLLRIVERRQRHTISK